MLGRMEDILDGLNDAQREAVTTTEGYVRVVAGAGSGKTRALTRRFAYLVNDLGIMPGNILCATFTNKAAQEMRRRIRELTGDRDTGYVNTFHGLCVGILQEDGHSLGYPRNMLVLDNSDIDQMLAGIYEERDLTLRQMTFSQARDMIEMRKCVTEPDYYLDMVTLPVEELKKAYDAASEPDDIIFRGYLYQERRCFGVDYNDLIFLTLYMFRRFPEIRLKWQKRLEYVMVDEFQDIDGPQHELMTQLCGYHRNLFVVGDPDQTIYTWRGADVRFLMDFPQDFPGTRTVMMTTNYRSTPQILDVANSLISKNRHRIAKDLVPVLPDGAPVTWNHAKDADSEAAQIAASIGALHGSGAAFRDIAVLYRAHYVTRAVEEALRNAKIPYVIYSGVQFFDRAEVKDALAYLRLVAEHDDLSFERVVNRPKRNMGRKRMAFLRAYADSHGCTLFEALERTIDDAVFKGTKARPFLSMVENMSLEYAHRPVSEALAAVLDASGYEDMLRTEGSQDRLDNLAELKQSAYDWEVDSGEETTMEDYLSHVALFSNQDAADSGDKVRLMTVHAAKGLEFAHVFLCGMNEGIFPSRKIRTAEQMEEERRLAFVAMTRARLGLHISEAEGFTSPDSSVRYPSRFLLDVRPGLLQFENRPDDTLLARTRDHIRLTQRWTESSSASFAVGDRVAHPVFGPGTVTEIDTQAGAYVIAFDDMPTPRAIAFRVKLQRADG
jgi:DNA helicase-2/ATP-dependent DNA helicase PcrA